MTPKKKRLRKAFILLIFSIVTPLATLLLTLIFESALIFFIGLLASIILAVCTYCEFDIASKGYCPQCGEKYDYDSDFAWQTLSETTNDKCEKTEVQFDICCHNCGKERTFNEKYTTASINKDGVIKTYNLTTMIENKYKKLRK